MSISQIDINATKLDFIRKSYKKYLGRCPSRWLSSNYSWQKREEEVEGIKWVRSREKKEEERGRERGGEDEKNYGPSLDETYSPFPSRELDWGDVPSWVWAFPNNLYSSPNSMDITWEMTAIEKSQPPPRPHPNLDQNLYKIPRLSTCKLKLEKHSPASCPKPMAVLELLRKDWLSPISL